MNINPYNLYLPLQEALNKQRGEFMYNETAVDVLGMLGTMISGSKSYYLNQHPDHTVFFNACVFNKDRQQIWYGDIDLTVSSDRLQQLANKIGTIYVTRETPFRWEGLQEDQTCESDRIKVFKEQS